MGRILAESPVLRAASTFVTFDIADVSYNYKYSVLIITVIVSITQRILIVFNNSSVDSLPAV